MSPCEQVTEDLAAIVDGDRDAIARHAEHLVELRRVSRRASRGATDREPPGRRRRRLRRQCRYARSPDGRRRSAEARAGRRDRRAGRRSIDACPCEAASRSAPRCDGDRRGVAALAATGDDLRRDYIAATATSTQPIVEANRDGPIGKLAQITRAAADKADGVMIRVGQGAWQPLHANDAFPPAPSSVPTSARAPRSTSPTARTSCSITRPRSRSTPTSRADMTLSSGRIVADVAHVETRPASVATPNGTIEVVGTRFEATAAADVTSVQVVRGEVVARATRPARTKRCAPAKKA